MKYTKILGLACLLLVGTASAAVMLTHWQNDTHATIDEAISIDNAESWVSFYAGESHIVQIAVENKANVPITMELKTDYSDGVGLDTAYYVGNTELPDDNENGKPELRIPAGSTVTLNKIITAAPNLVGGKYQITTLALPLN